MNAYELGQGVPLRYLAQNSDGVLIDADVALVVTAPNGTTPSVGVTHTATGTYDALPVPDQLGTWRFRWTATGAVTDARSGRFLTIDPDVPVTGAYAARNDLSRYATVPDDPETLLIRASRDVDRALLCAVYDPTDATIKAKLLEATCEQAAGYIAEGKAKGLTSGVSSFQIGRLSVTKGKTQAGSADPPAKVGALYEQAWDVLQAAGLTGGGPVTL